MCSMAQSLTNVWQIPCTPGQQEYILPEDFSDIINVLFHQGTQLRQMAVEQGLAQGGSYVSGTPYRFYIRGYTQVMAPQVGGSEIEIQDITLSAGRKPRKVIGLYPVPSSTNNLTVNYVQRHYYMSNMEDEPAIDDEYQRGWIDYATAMAKRKEEAYEEAQQYLNSFRDFAQQFAIASSNNDLVSFPKMRIRKMDGYSPFSGSSWVYVGDTTDSIPYPG